MVPQQYHKRITQIASVLWFGIVQRPTWPFQVKINVQSKVEKCLFFPNSQIYTIYMGSQMKQVLLKLGKKHVSRGRQSKVHHWTSKTRKFFTANNFLH
jgi:hypothetical protein